MRSDNPGFVPDSTIGCPLSNDEKIFFTRFPKPELHCHLLGTVTKSLFKELAEESKADISLETINEFYTRGEKPVGVLRIFRALEEMILRKPESLTKITYEHLKNISSHQVRYSELFLNWTGLAHSFSFKEAQDAVVEGIVKAREEFGVDARLVPAIDRESTPEKAVELVEQVLLNPSSFTPGIGMDYRETGHPPEKFWKAYRIAWDGGLNVTAHAGEFGEPYRNVETAVKLLGCNRVDHGYTVIDSPSLEAELRELNVIFAVVPTNSFYLRTLEPEVWAEKHPIRQMVLDGLRVFPNTDDPAMHEVNPSQAWSLMRSAFGFNYQQIRTFLVNAIDAAWVSPEQKQIWCKEWLTEFDQALHSLNLDKKQ